MALTFRIPAWLEICFKLLFQERWMSSVRLMLKDHQRERMQLQLPGKPSDPGRTGAANRLFVEAILWLAGTGVPRRPLA